MYRTEGLSSRNVGVALSLRLKRTLAGIAVAVALLAALPLAGGGQLATSVPTVHAEAQEVTQDAALPLEQRFSDLLNADRIEHGLEPLHVDPSLSAVARWRSEDMASRSYFSHDIGGYLVFSVLKEQGIPYRVAGENLAFNYVADVTTVDAAERALMLSPSHRANILRPDYTHVGVGIARADDGRYLFTQLFKKDW